MSDASENQEWVRKQMEEKGFTVDHRRVIMMLPKESVDILFLAMMRREFPDNV